MDWLDGAILIAIAVSTVAGFIRGLIRELFAFGAIILGLLIAYKFHNAIAPYLVVVIGNVSVAKAVGFVLILLFVSLGIGYMGRWLSALSKKSGLKPEDRRAGAMLGFIRGVVVVSFLLLAAVSLIPKSEPMIAKSTLGPISIRLARSLIAVLPDAVKGRFDAAWFSVGNFRNGITMIETERNLWG